MCAPHPKHAARNRLRATVLQLKAKHAAETARSYREDYQRGDHYEGYAIRAELEQEEAARLSALARATMVDLEGATLAPQTYGIACAQVRFGGPTGIWLECTGCDRNDRIVGSNSEEWAKASDANAIGIFLRHGWTGEGPKLLKAKCPTCSAAMAAKGGEGDG